MPNISLSRDIIAALFVACFALAAAIATEANKANKETIDVLEAEIIKRDELAAAWQEELAKERKAADFNLCNKKLRLLREYYTNCREY